MNSDYLTSIYISETIVFSVDGLPCTSGLKNITITFHTYWPHSVRGIFSHTSMKGKSDLTLFLLKLPKHYKLDFLK